MKILFIGNTRLGDAILSSCILNYYKEKDMNITVVCSPLSEDIYKNFPNVKRTIVVVKKKRAKHWLDVYKLLESICWDLVIDLRNTIISRIVRKKKILRLNKVIANKHRVVSLCYLLNIKKNISLNIPVKNKISKKAQKLINKNNIEKPILAIAPVTNWKRKNWPIDRFASLADGLIKEVKTKDKFKSIIILGSKKEEQECEALKKKIKNVKTINISGKYDIITIYALLKHCKLFVGNDSGLMHLSAAAKINTLGLFGPSKEVNYRPWGSKSHYLRTNMKYEQLVNTKGYNRFDSASLMTSLSVKKVLNKCLDILK